MAGNVWEYVDQVRQPSAEAVKHFPAENSTVRWYTIRGGSYLASMSEAIASGWAAFPADLYNVDIGFRCSKDP